VCSPGIRQYDNVCGFSTFDVGQDRARQRVADVNLIAGRLGEFGYQALKWILYRDGCEDVNFTRNCARRTNAEQKDSSKDAVDRRPTNLLCPADWRSAHVIPPVTHYSSASAIYARDKHCMPDGATICVGWDKLVQKN
jgi:hypothetical protein